MSNVGDKLLILSEYLRNAGLSNESRRVLTMKLAEEPQDKPIPDLCTSLESCNYSLPKECSGLKNFKPKVIDRGDGTTHTVKYPPRTAQSRTISFAANNADFPIIKVLVDKTGDGNYVESGHTLSGENTVYEFIDKWKSDICKHIKALDEGTGIVGVGDVVGPYTIDGVERTGKVLSVEKAGGESEVTRKSKVKVRWDGAGGVKDIVIAHPFSYKISITGFLDKYCILNKTKNVKLNEMEFITTCFQSGFRSKDGKMHAGEVPSETYKNYSMIGGGEGEESVAQRAWMAVRELEQDEKDSHGLYRQREHSSSECPDPNSIPFKITFDAPKEVRKGESFLIQADIAPEPSTKIRKDNLAVYLYYNDGTTDSKRSRAYLGQKVTDELYAFKPNIGKINTGDRPNQSTTIWYYISIECGGKSIFRTKSQTINVKQQ